MNFPVLDSSSEIIVSTDWCSKRMEINKEAVPGYSAEYADMFHDIHYYAAVCNWFLLCTCIYLMMHRTEVIRNF
jgi:hypothetical protein